ncbi:hypothetical protein C8R44DRAFT_747391 [Mycena epipterygia]|nr:hypothetical protein C8R44DRAFT_747391 [Mycena epipterygia]
MARDGIRAGEGARRQGGHCDVRLDAICAGAASTRRATAPLGVEKTTSKEKTYQHPLAAAICGSKSVSAFSAASRIVPRSRSTSRHQRSALWEDLAKNAHATGIRTNEYCVGLGVSVPVATEETPKAKDAPLQRKYGVLRRYRDSKRSWTGRVNPFFRWGLANTGALESIWQKLGIVVASSLQ